MSSAAVPVPASPAPVFGGPAASPLGTGGSTAANGAPNLYSGSTNTSGVAVPISSSGPGTSTMAFPNPAKNQLAPAVPVPGSNAQSPLNAGPAQPVSPIATPTTLTAAPNGLSVSANPGTSSSSAIPGATSPTSTGTPNSSVLNEATGEYGSGVGSQVAAQTASGGGYNSALAQQAVSSTDNAMQQQINQQYGSLQTSLANAGMSPDSSASALASSEFLSNASAAENQVAATQYTNMYQSSQQELTSLLETEMGQNNTDLNLTTAASDYLDYSSGTADLETGTANLISAAKKL